MYRVTIEQVSITEYPETQRKYVDPKTGRKFNSIYDADCPSRDQVKEVDEPTGRMLERKVTETTYEQTFEDLEVSALVAFLNK